MLGLMMVMGLCASAQEDPSDKNIVIVNSEKTFRFQKGNKEHPVQVKEESRIGYTSRNYRQELQVAEFYSEVESIDEVKIEIDGRKRKDIVPRYEYYNSDGIFYSDAHVCYFPIPVFKSPMISEIYFEKTTNDPNYFTSVYFMNPQETHKQTIKIEVPEWMQIEIKEFNFKGYRIQKDIQTKSDETIYVYSMDYIPAMPNEKSAPGPSHFVPHLLILSKTAAPRDEKIMFFNSLQDQYNWYRKLVLQIGNEPAKIKERALAITKGMTNDEQKVKAIFQWVQDNIRYIAFENGIAGFKPQKAQEVLSKKYGDCKGMANLMAELLRSIGLDARLCWLGTNHIAYDYSTPSMAVDNHMICAWMNKGKPLFLDATEKYIGFNEYAERIQGKQVLIENGDKYQLEKIPVAAAAQNLATENRKMTIEGNHLKGHIVQVWKGENKEWLLTNLNNIKQDRQDKVLKQYLSEGNLKFEIDNLKVINMNDYNADLKIEYDVVWKDVLSTFDDETYLELDNRKLLDGFIIDTAKRKLPYLFHFKQNNVLEIELQIPPGKTPIELPAPLQIVQPDYKFLASYKFNAGKLIYHTEVHLLNAEVKAAAFSQWNKDITQLSDYYNQQVILQAQNK